MTVCGAKKRKGGICGRPAGWGTDHPGEGKCKLHGGATPIKHGRYSTIARESLRDRIAEFEADPDPLNLLPEVAMLRAVLADLCERWDEIYGPDGALLAWHESFLDEEKNPNPKPRQLPDFAHVSMLAERVGKMVERVVKFQQEGSITMATFSRVQEQMGVALVRALRQARIDEATRDKILETVDSEWGAIRLEPISVRA